jgi:RNA recognition motif-containing protein
MNASAEEAEAHAKQSVKENRVYCGNLTYATTYKDLTDYMKEGGWNDMREREKETQGCRHQHHDHRRDEKSSGYGIVV